MCVDDIISTGDDLAERFPAPSCSWINSSKSKTLGCSIIFLVLRWLFLLLSYFINEFIHDLLQEFNGVDVTNVTCPLDLDVKLRVVDGALLPLPASYISLAGKLNFLTHTRSDLYFVVQHLSQFL